MPRAATPAGYSVPGVMVPGQGGSTGLLHLQTVPSPMGMEEAVELGKLQGSGGGGPGHLQSCYSGKAKTEERESKGLSTRGNALQLFLPPLALVSSQARGRTPGVPPRAALHHCKTTQELKTSRLGSAPDACSKLLPKVQAANDRMLSNGAAEGPLKSSRAPLWFSRMPGLSLH